jgi:hypothetical protein
MIREEIKKLEAIAFDIHAFQQTVNTTQGYDMEYYNNVYTTRDDSIMLSGSAFSDDPMLFVRVPRTGFWGFLIGGTHWKHIELTPEERPRVRAVYTMLEVGFDRHYVKPE